MGISKLIIKRSISLSKTYLFIGAFMVIGVIAISAVSSLSPAVPGGVPGEGFEDLRILAYFFVPFGAMSAVLISVPVLLLFVYDKNNGLLEYLLSVGKSQRDVFGSYLKASLAMAGAILLAAVLGNAAVVALLGGSALELPVISGVTLVLGLSAVAFSAVIMMAFSSLQKQRVGANQPLGIGLGILLIIPTYFLPIFFPAQAVTIMLVNAGAAAALAVAMFFLAGRLVKREKLLP